MEIYFGGGGILGLIAHGFMFTNKISFHDDIGQLFSMGQTFPIGRWFLGLISKFMDKSIGIYSLPWLNGIISLTFITISACLITELLGIKSIWGKVLVGGVMAAFPVVASIYLFMFTSAAYFAALLMMLFSLWLIEHYKYGFIGGIILFACSLGIYQAFLGVWIGVACCLLLKKCFDKEISFSKLLGQTTKYVGISIIGLILYLSCNKILSAFFHSVPTSYQGFDEIGNMNVTDILRGAGEGWITFFSFAFRDILGVSNNNIIRVAIVLCMVLSFLYLFRNCRENVNDIKKLCCAIIFSFAFPICVNIMYAICVMDESLIHTLMLYPMVLVFVIPVFLREQLSEKVQRRKKLEQKILLFALVVAVGYYIYYDNEIYLNAYLLQEQARSYFTVMISQIKGCEGYQDSMPVVYVGENNIDDNTLTYMDSFDNISINATGVKNLKDLINNYNYKAFMKYHCGFSPQMLNEEDWKSREEVLKMPCYPDDGAIRIIDGVVVVKLSDL